METQKENQHENLCYQYEKDHKRGKIIGGILVVIAGSLLLARELGADIPYWLFSWKTALIALGLLVGLKHRFKSVAWLFLILIGGAFLIADIYPDYSFKHLLWPLMIIFAGLFIIFKPRGRFKRNRHHFRNNRRFKKWQEYQQYQQQQTNPNAHFQKDDPQEPFSDAVSEDIIDGVAFMGGIKKKILSKDFKGGDITVVCGGVELDLSQADMIDKATLEISQVFGGTKIIVPSNWEIKSELVAVFASIEDKRMIRPVTLTNEATKILILKGTTVFGGIEIKSF